MSAETNDRRVTASAPTSLGRHDRTIDDANAFAPLPIMRLLNSVLIGHVAVIEKPALIRPFNIVSQPVDADPLESSSVCLNA